MRIGPVEAVVLVVLLVLLVVAISRMRTRRPAGATLAEIFGEPSTPLPGTRARVWALGVLNEAGVDADADPMYATKVLREAEPRLDAAAARLLVDTLNRS